MKSPMPMFAVMLIIFGSMLAIALVADHYTPEQVREWVRGLM